MPYYTYILRCEDGSLYTGITTDLPRRFAEHTGAAAKGAKYTAARRPVHYEAAWQSDDRSTASRLEYRIKTLTKPEKERLLQGEMPERLDFTGYVRINIAEASQNNSTAKLKTEELKMAKDSQLDPKEVRKQKANGGPTMAESALDGEGRNHKKQSSSRHKPGDDKR